MEGKFLMANDIQCPKCHAMPGHDCGGMGSLNSHYERKAEAIRLMGLKQDPLHEWSPPPVDEEDEF